MHNPAQIAINYRRHEQPSTDIYNLPHTCKTLDRFQQTIADLHYPAQIFISLSRFIYFVPFWGKPLHKLLTFDVFIQNWNIVPDI